MRPQAQGESLIRKALTELKLWALQRSFAFVSGGDAAPRQAASHASDAPSSGNGSDVDHGRAGSAGGDKAVPLIKDWAAVLSEIGDHQALAASLKLSPYHAMFKVINEAAA